MRVILNRTVRSYDARRLRGACRWSWATAIGASDIRPIRPPESGEGGQYGSGCLGIGAITPVFGPCNVEPRCPDRIVL